MKIVAMKNVVKKAKVIQIGKIVRKIKMTSKKKGNDAQLEKNKRKCEHLKEEILNLKVCTTKKNLSNFDECKLKGSQ
jgi:hypothetical protein